MKWTIKTQNNADNKSMHSFIKQYFLKKKCSCALCLYSPKESNRSVDIKR